jgi:hypothetical protein
MWSLKMRVEALTPICPDSRLVTGSRRTVNRPSYSPTTMNNATRRLVVPPYTTRVWRRIGYGSSGVTAQRPVGRTNDSHRLFAHDASSRKNGLVAPALREEPARPAPSKNLPAGVLRFASSQSVAEPEMESSAEEKPKRLSDVSCSLPRGCFFFFRCIQ